MEFRIPKPELEAVFLSASQVVDWGLLKHKIPSLWDKTQGEGVRVAILDSGSPVHIDTCHSILDNKTFIGKDSIDEDMVGHGIFCTGIVAANNNEFGVVGVAPKSSVVFCRVLKSSGAGNPSHIIKGIEYAIENNVDIISISFGARQDVPEIKEVIKKAYDRGIVLVAAAGNDKVENSVNYPARYEEVISVGAVNESDTIADFCSKGYKVDVYAPGVYITSTYLNHSYACMSGTSFATPFVAGIIALAISLRRKNKKPIIVKDIIELIKTTPLRDFVEKYGTLWT